MKIDYKYGLVLVLAGLCLVGWLVFKGAATSAPADPSKESVVKQPVREPAHPTVKRPPTQPVRATEPAAVEPEEAASEEEPVDPEEAKVDAFDALVDKWMEPTAREITFKETSEFVGKLRQVPSERREECLQRALNLVPDENVMLLAGVLLDKSMETDLVELVFQDVLNRDESVKLPILKQVVRDKTHPCFADAAWILDVTGQNK